MITLSLGTGLTTGDCHVRPDLVLIYRKPDTEQLFLTRLGSHSQVFEGRQRPVAVDPRCVCVPRERRTARL